MMMLNDMSDVDDGLNTPGVIKAIKSIGSQDIFQLIVQACQRFGSLRPEVAKQLQQSASPSANTQGADKAEPSDDINALLDTSMLDFGNELSTEAIMNNGTESNNDGDHLIVAQVS